MIDDRNKNTGHRYLNARANGVTINQEFLSILSSGACLTTSHMLFFAKLFAKYFGGRRKVRYDQLQIFSVDCYFFAEFMPDLTAQLPNDIIEEDKIMVLQEKILQQQSMIIEKEQIVIQKKEDDIDQNLFQAQEIKQDQQYEEKQVTKISEKTTFEAQSIQIDAPQDIQENLPNQNNKISQINHKKQQPKFEITIVNLTITKNASPGGQFRFQRMKEQLQNYAKDHKLSIDKNPIYEYDYAFFPINLSNSHWISLLVHIKERVIIYQDSLRNIRSNIQEGIKHVLAHQQVSEFQWQFHTKTPSQRGTLDCGVFVLYSLFLLYTTGEILKENTFNQELIRRVRQNLVKLTLLEISETLVPDKIIEIVKLY